MEYHTYNIIPETIFNKRTKVINIYIQIPYYNKHITPIFDELSKTENISLKIGLLEPGANFRSGYDWDNEIDENIYIRLWLQKESILPFIENADVLGVHGFFSFRDNYKLILYGLKKRRKILIFSEGLKKKNFFNNLVKSILIRRINDKRIHFFELGHNAFSDYQLKGANKWQYHKFAYSVDPVYQNNKHDQNNKLKLLYVGQLIKRKRPLDMLYALSKCDTTRFSLEVYGGGDLSDEIIQAAKLLGLEKNVFYQGIKSREEIMKFMLNGDCLILPSEYDGWGAVVNEAMECGLIVIVSSGVRAKSIIDEQFIYETGNIDQLATLINSLLESPNLVKNTKLKNKETIANYRPNQLAKTILNVIKN